MSTIDKTKAALYRLPAQFSMVAVFAWAEGRITELREERQRGDVSITTVIIWVAVIALAGAIAAVIATLSTKYKAKLSGE